MLLGANVSIAQSSPSAEQAFDAFDAMEYELALELFNSPELRNDPGAVFSLGLMYYEGLAVDPNQNLACELFDRAVQLGNSDARRYAEVCASQGVPFTTYRRELRPSEYRWTFNNALDLTKAAELYEANGSNLHIGEMYEAGIGVVPSYLKAWDVWAKDENPFTRGASRRLLAQSMIRVCGLDSSVVPLVRTILASASEYRDPLSDMLIRSVNNAHFRSTVNRLHGVAYSQTFTSTICRSEIVGGDLDSDALEALLYELVSEGDVDAGLILSMSLYSGDFGNVDKLLAEELVRDATASGSPRASYVLATILDYSDGPTSFNMCEGYFPAARGGVSAASLKVALGILSKEHGCELSDETALQMLLDSASGGSADASAYYLMLVVEGRIPGNDELVEQFSLVLSANYSDVFDAHPALLNVFRST